MPMALSGANLWSKQECVIAVGDPRWPQQSISQDPAHSNNPLSGECAQGHFLDPLSILRP